MLRAIAEYVCGRDLKATFAVLAVHVRRNETMLSRAVLDSLEKVSLAASVRREYEL